MTTTRRKVITTGCLFTLRVDVYMIRPQRPSIRTTLMATSKQTSSQLMKMICWSSYWDSSGTGRYAVIGCKLKQNANERCNSCASLAGLVLCFIACFILLVIAPLGLHDVYRPVAALILLTLSCWSHRPNQQQQRPRCLAKAVHTCRACCDVCVTTRGAKCPPNI